MLKSRVGLAVFLLAILVSGLPARAAELDLACDSGRISARELKNMMRELACAPTELGQGPDRYHRQRIFLERFRLSIVGALTAINGAWNQGEARSEFFRCFTLELDDPVITVTNQWFSPAPYYLGDMEFSAQTVVEGQVLETRFARSIMSLGGATDEEIAAQVIVPALNHWEEQLPLLPPVPPAGEAEALAAQAEERFQALRQSVRALFDGGRGPDCRGFPTREAALGAHRASQAAQAVAQNPSQCRRMVLDGQPATASDLRSLVLTMSAALLTDGVSSAAPVVLETLGVEGAAAGAALAR